MKSFPVVGGVYISSYKFACYDIKNKNWEKIIDWYCGSFFVLEIIDFIKTKNRASLAKGYLYCKILTFDGNIVKVMFNSHDLPKLKKLSK